MTRAEMLTALKIDLGITADAYDGRLEQYLQNAEEQIGIEGATLNPESLSDGQLIIMYAAWMWRKRDSGEGMPRMLRYALNNRILSEKMEGSNG